jgi:Transposase DDE domain
VPRRKQTPEPVFGIIKSVMGFRQFLLRGLDNVQGEWSLVTMAWNMKRMYATAAAGNGRPCCASRFWALNDRHNCIGALTKVRDADTRCIRTNRNPSPTG